METSVLARISNALRRPTLRYALPAAIAAALAIIILDQASKWFVVEQMNLRQTLRADIFPGLSFRMAWNTGVNFGFLSGGGDASRFLLAAGTSLVSLVLVLSSLSCRRMISAVGLGIAAGGAIGNTIDRLNWGAVADFLNVTCCGIENPWSFNIADIAVFAGFALLILPLGGKPAPTDLPSPG
ncbi:MAG: signal peptidase II [Hyphomonadaceae bacterium]|nr:signal peptidase II [Hyphomonadaceae bacterium]